MPVDKPTFEAIDACRPGSDDLHDSPLAGLAARVGDDPDAAVIYRKIQQQDLRIVRLMAEVIDETEVPAGLEERLLRAVRADAQPAAVARRRWSWRGSVAASFAVAAALVIAAWFTVWDRTVAPETADQLSAAALAWFDEAAQSDQWQSGPAPVELPKSPRIALPVRRWFSVDAGRRGVLYDLTPLGSKYRVLLAVLPIRVDGLSSFPPSNPTWTLDRSVAQWQSGELAYVLLVEGPRGRYRRYVDTGVGPLAHREIPRKARLASPA